MSFRGDGDNDIWRSANPTEIIIIIFTQTLDDDQTDDYQYMSYQEKKVNFTIIWIMTMDYGSC